MCAHTYINTCIPCVCIYIHNVWVGGWVGGWVGLGGSVQVEYDLLTTAALCPDHRSIQDHQGIQDHPTQDLSRVRAKIGGLVDAAADIIGQLVKLHGSPSHLPPACSLSLALLRACLLARGSSISLHTHAYTQTHTHTYATTHANTHIRSRPPPPPLSAYMVKWLLHVCMYMHVHVCVCVCAYVRV
jgi:hypothetical protein